MWQLLLSLINPISSIIKDLSEAKKAEALAEAASNNEAERIAARERVATLEAKVPVVLNDPYGPLIRFAIAVPYILYNAKLVLWDKVLAWGTTDPLGVELAAINTMILGFYFLRALKIGK